MEIIGFVENPNEDFRFKFINGRENYLVSYFSKIIERQLYIGYWNVENREAFTPNSFYFKSAKIEIPSIFRLNERNMTVDRIYEFY